MSVVLEGNAIAIRGDCGVEEAETLMSMLQVNPHAPVDVSEAGSVHTALWQVMIAMTPRVTGEPSDAFVLQWIMPLLTGASESSRT